MNNSSCKCKDDSILRDYNASMQFIRNSAVLSGLSFLIGAATVIGILFSWLFFGNLPVAVADVPLPFERQLAHRALERRLTENVKTTPTQNGKVDLAAAAYVYAAHCAVCHGIPGQKAEVGSQMFPRAPQLWASHRAGVVGVSDDPVNETFWKVKNGIRLSGMPSFSDTLSTGDMWQVSLLLSQANQQISPTVLSALQGNGVPESK